MKKYIYETYLGEKLGVSFKGQGLVWNTAEDVAPVVHAIKECKNMKYLELEGNTLGITAAKEIGKALESHPELEIALWKDLFTTRLKSEIPQALSYLFAGIDLAGAHLQRLDLSDNAIGPVAMPGLVPFFQTPSSFYIEELIVNNEGLGAEGGSTFAAALMECLDLSKKSGERVLQLKVFQCGRNRQDNKGTINWAKLFGAIGTLEEIHMPQNGINPPAIKALVEAFRNNPNIRVINLEDNTVRHDGAELLSVVIPTLVNLEELNLSDCLIRSTGAKHVANAIRDLQNLQRVQLCSNEIKKSGGMVLASILRSLPNLSSVNLSGNEFGEHGCEEIGHLLSHITEVTMDDDEGEGEEEGEDTDENKENENEEEDEEEEPELEGDKVVGNGSTFLIHSMSSGNEINSRPVEIEPEVKVEDFEAASQFISNPSIETYMKLLPKPATTLIQFFQNRKQDYEFHDLCIYAALSMSKIMGPNSPDNVNALLNEALRNTNANGFATSLFICLGRLKPEKGVKGLLCKPSDLTIIALSEYLQKESAPVTIFRCIQLFVSQAISADIFNALNSEYRKLLDVIKTQLSICKF